MILGGGGIESKPVSKTVSRLGSASTHRRQNMFPAFAEE